MGRRIEKNYRDASTKFVYDGNVILHEFSNETTADDSNWFGGKTAIDKGLITWVYEADSFIPTAKIQGEKRYSIVSNYLGTPEQAYDENGNKVWECELDIYGNVRNLTGKIDFVPFRYQGQYHDVETDLYYNRFRYYSSEDGSYISQDPIGLEGGNESYKYVKCINSELDPLGLWTYYVLKDSAGKVVYHGITDRPIQDRLTEHAKDGKKFSQVDHVKVKSRAAARNLEGSALYHSNMKGEALYNKPRVATRGGFYHQYDPNNIAKGRKLLSKKEINNIMKNGKKGVSVNCKGKIQ